MDVATIEDVLESENQGKAVEAPPPSELTMQQLSRILAGVDTFKECITENENCSTCTQKNITRFIRTPDAATPPPPMPGLAPSAEDNDDVDFLGFEDVLQEAEDLMRDQGTNDSDGDD
ncbi:hypothetical protein E2C01_033498 [Portunus trituberculatus]|uniref:Uncharacterized protein n=1 Tax=Portunus trituberculatus TaxID=210409 RepID=A0A5B7F2L0_PORTR|nr:hypothetical protein [Portunus trituberculatus]